jgi:hypothetical protein
MNVGIDDRCDATVWIIYESVFLGKKVVLSTGEQSLMQKIKVVMETRGV